MKNKTLWMDQPSETKSPNWLYYQEVQEDDFLMGKTPKTYPDSWEEEE